MVKKPILKEVQSEPVVGVVELLEQKLQEAKDGKIRSVGLVCVEKGDIIGTAWERGDSGSHMHQLTAGAAYLHYRLCTTAVGGCDD